MRELVLLSVLLFTGCTNTPEASPSAPTQPPSACESKYTRDQFVGTWAAESSKITLAGDGSIDAAGKPGQWEFTSWAKTPQAAPAGQGDQCVLWLKETPLDLVYLPLKVTPESLSLSYVGRGNTVTWAKQGLD